MRGVHAARQSRGQVSGQSVHLVDLVKQHRILGFCLCAAVTVGCSDDHAISGNSGGGGAAGSGSGGAAAGAAADAGTTSDATLPIDPDLRAPKFVKAWGKQGTLPGQFIEPSSVELDAEGNVYVAGHEDRLQKFTFDGKLLNIFGKSGVGDLEFNHPHGLAMDRAAGLLYAGDQNNGRVQVLTTDGKFVRMWTDPQFKHIHDVGIDPLSGDIFVGDFELHVMQKFTSTGVPLLEFGGAGSADGQFAGAWGISTDSAGRVYVGDAGNKRVQVFNSDGSYLAQWQGFVKPTGVFVDAKDRVYVCDSLADQIAIYSTQGQRLGTWDLASIVGSPCEPEDIVITADSMHIYVGDVLSHRVIYLARDAT